MLNIEIAIDRSEIDCAEHHFLSGRELVLPEGKTMRILLIDDHSMIRAGVKHLIMKMQNEVEIFEAMNAKEGLQIANQEDLDLIFLDLKLPPEAGGACNSEVGLNVVVQT